MKRLIPKSVDPIKLADRIKKGMTFKVLKDLEELKKVKSRLAKQS